VLHGRDESLNHPQRVERRLLPCVVVVPHVGNLQCQANPQATATAATPIPPRH
jgi:hypothetical protein